MSKKLISICIPSYNRPDGLLKLLQSIDCDANDVNIIISEDFSPLRLKIRSVVENFKLYSKYDLCYCENKINLGYDANLRHLVELSNGYYVMFMGDDDLFVPRALDKFLIFLKANLDKPYILRSYLTQHANGSIEYFKYLPRNTILKAGESTVSWLFKRSVSLCGFTVSRELALKYSTTELDGTLLYQVYLMSKICLIHDSIYCNIPITHAVQSFRNDDTFFGNSETEKGRYTPGSISINNSINFTKSYFEVAAFLDKKNSTNLSILLRLDLSKYSYPFLSIQRKRGIYQFLKYSNKLEKNFGMGCTFYFYIYKWSLVFFGEKICDLIINKIKKFYGYTPIF